MSNHGQEKAIRSLTQTLTRHEHAKPTKKAKRQFWGRSFIRSRKRIVRYGLLTANLALLVAVVWFVTNNPNHDVSAGQGILNSETNTVATNPLDQLSSADIAVNVSRLVRLEEATAVTNQADSESVLLAVSPADDVVVAKPQIVSTNSFSRRDIRVYKTVAGDTIATVATKFNVTSDSIRWSNNLTTEALTAGRDLYIPPINGIVYLVKSGDTVDKLAKEYNANKASIVDFNDAYNGLPIGERIVIPDGIKPSNSARVIAGGLAFGTAAVYGYNGYDYGWCTWYVASKISIPANWGNANTWDNYAARSGWTVSTTPRAGAIAQTDRGGLGHVGIVEAVSEDGSMIKYSDMNGLAGWGRVGYSDWVPTLSKFQKFIYR